MENATIQDVTYSVFWLSTTIFVYKHYNFIIDNKWSSEFFKVKKNFDKKTLYIGAPRSTDRYVISIILIPILP